MKARAALELLRLQHAELRAAIEHLEQFLDPDVPALIPRDRLAAIRELARHAETRLTPQHSDQKP